MEKRKKPEALRDSESVILENQRNFERQRRADEVRYLLRDSFQKITVINEIATPFDYALRDGIKKR